MSRAVHIIAVDARTPVGLFAETSAAAVRGNISRVREHPFLVDSTGEKLRCATDGRFAPSTLGAERLMQLVHSPLQQVARKLTQRGSLETPVPILLALPEVRPGHSNQDAERIASFLSHTPVPGLPRVTVHRIGLGHAGALHALEVGAGAIAEGKAELCLIAGVDSYLCEETLDWLDSKRRLARENVRSGFSPGEAAAVLAISSKPALAARGLSSLACVRGVASATEPGSLDSDAGILGHGLTDVVRRAAAGLDPRAEKIDAVHCDINGERHRSDEWGFTLMRTGSLFRDGTAYTTPVSAVGDTGAATGVLSCVLAVQSWQRHYAQGPRALIWGSSWGGMRAAALLEGRLS